MARQQMNRLQTPSLLDRLILANPEDPQTMTPAAGQTVSQLKESVRRDLMDLLNTRIRFTAGPEHLTELRRSLVDYGLEDFSGHNLDSDQDRQAFCQHIAEVIRQNEPRLMNVEVDSNSNDEEEKLKRTFRFTIRATLRLDPMPERILFDSQVNPATATVVLQGAE